MINESPLSGSSVLLAQQSRRWGGELSAIDIHWGEATNATTSWRRSAGRLKAANKEFN